MLPSQLWLAVYSVAGEEGQVYVSAPNIEQVDRFVRRSENAIFKTGTRFVKSITLAQAFSYFAGLTIEDLKPL